MSSSQLTKSIVFQRRRYTTRLTFDIPISWNIPWLIPISWDITSTAGDFFGFRWESQPQMMDVVHPGQKLPLVLEANLWEDPNSWKAKWGKWPSHPPRVVKLISSQ
jgi:hypothetical protein